MNKKITLQDVKQALLDDRFRETLPENFKEDIKKFLDNPGCSCNHPIYRKVLKDASKQLALYYPSKEIVEEEESNLLKNEWTVINCHINDLQKNLRRLGPGRKQLDVARWEDQVTVVVNELDIIF